MQELFPKATTEVADKSDWIKLCENKSKDSVVYLNSIFSTAAKDSKSKGDEPTSEFYGLLAQVFSLYFKADKAEEPFGPMWVMNGSRTAIVTDFSDLNLDVLSHLVGKSREAAVNARLSDILWLRRKNRVDAEKAIESYLSHSQENLKAGTEGWIYGFESLQRACQLWKQIGRPEKFTTALQTLVDSCLQKSDAEPNDYFRVKVLRVVTQYGLATDAASMQQWTESLADQIFKSNDFDKAREYLESSSDFARQNKDSATQTRIKRKIVDYFVEEAQKLKADGAEGLLLADRYSKAIEAARRHGGLRPLIDELHIEMNEAQEKALSELKPMEISIDVTKYVNAGREAVNSVPLEQTLVQIAKLAAPGSIQDLRKIVEQAAQKNPLMHHISGVIFNDKGRVVARTAPALATDEEEQEAGVQAQMIAECGCQQELLGRSLFQAARLALDERLPVGANVFESLVNQNPFVPEGREGLYLKGLKAGLYGDFVSCAHHLIPQLENSIRSYMEASGKLVTRLTDDMTQKEHDLNNLLYETTVKEIFGGDLIYALRVLLVEELGGNFRNRLAHGLLHEGHFYSGWVNYLWAITIRMLWLGRLVMDKWQSEQAAKSGSSNLGKEKSSE